MENRFEEKYCQLNDEGLKDFENELLGIFLKGEMVPNETIWFEGILIEKYTNNEWDENQKSEIEKKLALDADLMEFLNKSLKATHILEQMKEESKIRNLIREQLENATFHTSDNENRQIEKSKSLVDVKTRWLLNGWFISAAAIMLLFLGIATVLWYYQRPVTSEQLFADFYFPEEPDFIITRDNSDENVMLSQAQQAYLQNDDETTIRLLTILNDRIPSNWSYLMNLGILQMKTGDFDSAIITYNRIVAGFNSPATEKALWNLGLCYLKTSKSDDARRVFFKLQSSGLQYSKNASKVLKKMKGIKPA